MGNEKKRCKTCWYESKNISTTRHFKNSEEKDSKLQSGAGKKGGVDGHW